MTSFRSLLVAASRALVLALRRPSAALLPLLLAAANAQAAVVLVTAPDGRLTGARNVDVSGVLYDVTFVDGTCASVYGSCTPAAFDFTTATDAAAATQALMDQVFVGVFDDSPNLVAGCGEARLCRAYLAYGLEPGETGYLGQVAVNFASGLGNDVRTGFGASFGFTTSGSGFNVFADFTRSATASVPEPSTMLLAGLAFLSAAFLRRRGCAAPPFGARRA